MNESFDKEDIIESNNETKKIDVDTDIINKNSNNDDKYSHLNEPNDIYLINQLFIEYKKKFSELKNTWWPVNVTYGGKKYYVASQTCYLNNPKTNIIYYFCFNHLFKSPYKRMLFCNKKCDGKLKFIHNTKELYIIHNHNEICDIKNKKIYDNLAHVEHEINDFTNYNENLILYLNKNPLIGYKNFKNHTVKIYLKNDYELTIKKIAYQIYLITGEIQLKFLVGYLFMII